jgi:hypothetical protein
MKIANSVTDPTGKTPLVRGTRRMDDNRIAIVRPMKVREADKPAGTQQLCLKRRAIPARALLPDTPNDLALWIQT